MIANNANHSRIAERISRSEGLDETINEERIFGLTRNQTVGAFVLLASILAVTAYMGFYNEAQRSGSAASNAPRSFAGILKAAKNSQGKVTAMAMKDNSGTVYYIARGPNWEKLAREGNGETVEIQGTVTDTKIKLSKDKEIDGKLLTINSFDLVFKGAVGVEKKDGRVVKISIGKRNVKLDAKAQELVAFAGKEVQAFGSKIHKVSGSVKNDLLIIRNFHIINSRS